MNNIDFKQTGGFPLDTNVLDFMQSSWQLLQAFGELAGNLSILQGCVKTGSNVSDGVVYINGEVLPFKGGTGAKVIIKTETTALEFEDGKSKPVEQIRYATFGIGSVAWNWSEFKRVYNLQQLMQRVCPIGIISMWSGAVSAIPAGWALCDGTNGTPDLRGRFVVGAGSSYDVGDKGGEEKHTLTKAEMPKHGHNATVSQSGRHTHLVYDHDGTMGAASNQNGNEGHFHFGEGGNGTQTSTNAQQYAGAHTHAVSIAENGGGKEHENRPPFYALAYVMFKG